MVDASNPPPFCLKNLCGFFKKKKKNLELGVVEHVAYNPSTCKSEAGRLQVQS
jgi:hypothetical protein